MKILSFLQNQWYPPDKIKYIRYAYGKHATTPEDRADLNARYLFFRCLSGKRIRAAFGEDLCNEIVWENASPEIGDNPSAVFPSDLTHMRSCIECHKPDLVIAFGKVAAGGVEEVWDGPRIITCHPAARQNAPKQLSEAADKLHVFSAAFTVLDNLRRDWDVLAKWVDTGIVFEMPAATVVRVPQLAGEDMVTTFASRKIPPEVKTVMRYVAGTLKPYAKSAAAVPQEPQGS